jgi:hypothetical protein
MAILNFPDNPQVDDQYTGDNGTTYIYDGVKWVGHAAGGAAGTNSIQNGSYTVQVDVDGNLVLPVGSIIKDAAGDPVGGSGTSLINGSNQVVLEIDGSITFPTKTFKNWQDSNETGPTLQLGNDPASQVLITGPVPNNTYFDAQRIVIQGQQGYGGENNDKGEGGDVYIWAGSGGDPGSLQPRGDGGDVKLRGGIGGNYGGYIRVESGDAQADSGIGGFLDLNAGNGTGTNSTGGNVNIRAGQGTGNGGQVNIYTATTDSYNNQWVFGKDGSLTLPRGTTLGERTWTSAIASITTGAATYITLTNSEFGYAETGQITITGVEGATQLNDTWYYQAEESNQLQLFYFEDRVATVDSTGWAAWTVDTGTVTLVTETVLTVNNNTWKFSQDGSTSFPPGRQVSFDENNNSYISSGGNMPWDSNGLNIVSSDSRAVAITAIDTSIAGQAQFNSWYFNLDGTLQLPNYVKQNTNPSVVCNAGMDTVVYTGSDQYLHTFKLLLKVEGVEVNGQASETQSTEMIIAKSFNGDKVAASVYGVVHTSVAPLATFTAQWNATTSRLEVLCRPTSLTYGVEVRTFATEISTSD